MYTFNTSKQTFKKSKILSNFHKYLQKVGFEARVGFYVATFVSRDWPDDRVLDMCAAPGSITSQILEMMYGDKGWQKAV